MEPTNTQFLLQELQANEKYAINRQTDSVVVIPTWEKATEGKGILERLRVRRDRHKLYDTSLAHVIKKATSSSKDDLLHTAKLLDQEADKFLQRSMNFISAILFKRPVQKAREEMDKAACLQLWDQLDLGTPNSSKEDLILDLPHLKQPKWANAFQRLTRIADAVTGVRLPEKLDFKLIDEDVKALLKTDLEDWWNTLALDKKHPGASIHNVMKMTTEEFLENAFSATEGLQFSSTQNLALAQRGYQLSNQDPSLQAKWASRLHQLGDSTKLRSLISETLQENNKERVDQLAYDLAAYGHRDEIGGLMKQVGAETATQIKALWEGQDLAQIRKIEQALNDAKEALAHDPMRLPEGIFRISPDKADLQQLTNSFTEGRLTYDELKAAPPHAVASFMKQIMRSVYPLLPAAIIEQLLPLDLDHIQFTEKVRQILSQLPPQKKQLLKTLFIYLSSIIPLENQTKMPASNLAIIWAPTLTDSPPTKPTFKVIEELIKQAHLFFQEPKSE